MKKHDLLTILFLFSLLCCNSQPGKRNAAKTDIPLNYSELSEYPVPYDTTVQTIHIFVALCDNVYQGIIPVPEILGNGQDPDRNLYWGSAFGIRTFFRKSKEWKLVKIQKMDSVRLERLVFKHIKKNCYLVADAYDGKYIRESVLDFLNSSCGKLKDTLHVNHTTIGIAGNSQMTAYIGHDGLMDFDLDETFVNTDQRKRDIIILSCYSKEYFSKHLARANVNPLVWTTGLMCPEAYTIHDAITGYLENETNEKIRTRAALAYSRYQKCSQVAAKALLVTGW